jgi:hypothetical protein
LPLPPIGGSDCHALHEAASAVTRLAVSVPTTVELVAELRHGRHAALRLSSRDQWSA